MSAPSFPELFEKEQVVTLIVPAPPELPNAVLIESAPPLPEDNAVFESKEQLLIVAVDPRPTVIAPP
jgi:hypothetical protein